jgi:hypothetical protein
VPKVNEHGVTSPQPLPPPLAKELGELTSDPSGDLNELLEYRFLCRGGGLLLAGPTGIGKSAFILQCAILWANGQPAFGINPATQPLILLVQAENDEADMVEIRNGVFAGLKLSKADRDYACERVLIATESARTSSAFVQDVLRPLLEKHFPDLLIIDPALAYLGGDFNSQKDVGSFLRNQLNPLLNEFNCGCIVVHHTNKPPQGKEKSNWQAGDFAYMGGGSAEWANWARAVLAIRSIGSNEVFELRAGKRGGRLGWEDEAGQKQYCKFIAHAKEEGVICWREPDASEIPAGPEAGPSPESVVLSLVPETGTKPKESVINDASEHEHRVGKQKARRILKELIKSGSLFEHRVPRRGNKPEIHISRKPQDPAA